MFRPITMSELAEAEQHTTFVKTNSYLRSYRAFITYCASRVPLTVDDLIIATHFTYGWMPTKLDLYFDDAETDLGEVTTLINQVRARGTVTAAELHKLRAVINHSLVGTSKVLHFANPQAFPIWDTKVYAYLTGQRPYAYRVEQIPVYLEYVRLCEMLAADSLFAPMHDSVNTKLGYPVSAYRALELIMFMQQ